MGRERWRGEMRNFPVLFCITAPDSHYSIIVVQSLSHVWLFVTPWAAVRQASLSFTIFWSLLKFMSIESVMLPKHLILCRLLLLLPSIFPSIRVFTNESALYIMWPNYWRFSISLSNVYSGLKTLETPLACKEIKPVSPKGNQLWIFI